MRAPPPEIPVPFRVKASAVPSAKPPKSRAAPAVTVVPAPVVPSGVFVPPPVAPSFRIPALTVVKPVYVLDPLNVHVPVPDFVSVPEPVPMILVNVEDPEPFKVRL